MTRAEARRTRAPSNCSDRAIRHWTDPALEGGIRGLDREVQQRRRYCDFVLLGRKARVRRRRSVRAVVPTTCMRCLLGRTSERSDGVRQRHWGYPPRCRLRQFGGRTTPTRTTSLLDASVGGIAVLQLAGPICLPADAMREVFGSTVCRNIFYSRGNAVGNGSSTTMMDAADAFEPLFN